MSRLSVLAVIDSLGAGGAERSFLELLPALTARDVHLRFACFEQRAHGVEAEVRRLGAPVEILDASSLMGRVSRLRRLIGRETPDVIHTTLFQSDLAGRLANIFNRTPLLTSIVNTSYDRARRADPQVSQWKLEAVRVVDGFGARHMTDHFHALTQTAAEEAVRSLGVGPADITVIPRSRDPLRFLIDRDAERLRVRAELGLGDEPVIVAVGREEFQKGHIVLIEALREVRRRLPDTHLVLVGRPGNASHDIEAALDRLDLGDAVIRTSFRADVPSLLAAADLFAFPSHYEGFGGAMIEAMAMEIPIVCSDIPALREVLADPDAAALTPPGDPESLAHILVETLSHPAVGAGRARKARQVYEQRYTPDAVAPLMAALYRAVAVS